MKDLFVEQLKVNAGVTREFLDLLENKKYLSGVEMKEGDLALACLLVTELSPKDTEIPHRSVELVFIQEEDFSLYEPAGLYEGALIPTIKYKTDEKA